MRIAVLGLGFMGSTHLKAYKNIPSVQVAAVASSSEKKLAGDLSEIQGNIGGPGEKMDFSGVRKYRTPEEAVRDPDGLDDDRPGPGRIRGILLVEQGRLR